MYNVFQKIKFSLMKIKEHDNECVLVTVCVSMCKNIHIIRGKFKQYLLDYNVSQCIYSFFFIIIFYMGYIIICVPNICLCDKCSDNKFYNKTGQ